MAGAGYKLFNTGDVLTAAQVNTYLMEQTVMVFANAAARTTALSGVVSEGMISYLKDTNAVEVYDGSNWVSSDDPNAIQNTIVDAKGDLISASAADVPARLAVGNNGETLVADSSATTGLRWQSNQAGGKNYLINGAMEFFQRGSISAAGYALDRWKTTSYGTSWNSLSFTQGTTTPPEGFRYYMRVAAGSSTSTNIGFGQTLETTDVVKFANKTVTLSFYYRVNTNFTNTWTVTPVYSTGTDADLSNVPNGTSIGSSQTISNTSSWTRFTYSFAVPSTATSFGIQFFNNGNTVSTASFDITGVQLEIGSVATTFQRSAGTLAGELAACQRYYEKSYASATAIGTASVSQAFNGFYTVGSNQKMVNPGIWKVQKRTSPTVTVYDDAGNSGKISTLDTGGTATNNVAIAIIDTDDTSFRALGSSNGTQAGYKWNWVASAEL